MNLKRDEKIKILFLKIDFNYKRIYEIKINKNF